MSLAIKWLLWLWLHKKLPQNLAAKNNHHFILSHDFVGQEFRWGLLGDYFALCDINWVPPWYLAGGEAGLGVQDGFTLVSGSP